MMFEGLEPTFPTSQRYFPVSFSPPKFHLPLEFRETPEILSSSYFFLMKVVQFRWGEFSFFTLVREI